MHINLRDVARAAGVSKSTAQRALSHDARCLDSTREKVRAAAERLGYVPDPVFAAMGARRRQSGNRSVPVAYLECVGVRPHPGGPYLEPASERARELGYRLEVVDLETWHSVRSLWQVLYARGFAGVIVGSIRPDRVALLEGNDRFPVVCAGRVAPLPYHCVRPAIGSGVRRVHELLRERGYRRIGHAVMRHESELEDDFERYSAALGCMHSAGDPQALPPVLTASIDDHAALTEWARRHRPDAVIGFHKGMVDVLRSSGIRVPESCAFASLHLSEGDTLALLGDAVSGLMQNYRLIGATAVNLLDQMIRHGECGQPALPFSLEVSAAWVEGRTTPLRAADQRTARARRAS